LKIDNYVSNPWLDPVSRPKTEGSAAVASTASGSPDRNAATKSAFPEDSVHVSSVASDDVRANKVEALQRALAAGTYQVSTEDIADAILRDWKE
jgi:flagellar biosynthesis anti-sigma factor FlgM